MKDVRGDRQFTFTITNREVKMFKIVGRLRAILTQEWRRTMFQTILYIKILNPDIGKDLCRHRNQLSRLYS